MFAPNESVITSDPVLDEAEAKAQAHCVRLLSSRPYTELELITSLQRKETPDDIIDRVITRLIQAGLIDDVIFANEWVASRYHRRGIARHVLVRELRARGVEQHVIDAAMEHIDDFDEMGMAYQLASKRLPSMEQLPEQTQKRRLSAYLFRKGYSAEVISTVLYDLLSRAYQDEDDDDFDD